MGGRDGSSCLRTVECYDPHTNRWTLVAPMSKRRGGVGVAVAHGFLYAFGGHDAPASNPSAARFDCVERCGFYPITVVRRVFVSLTWIFSFEGMIRCQTPGR